MNDQLLIVAHLAKTLAKLLGPGSTKAIVADSLLTKWQRLVVNQFREGVPHLDALFGTDDLTIPKPHNRPTVTSGLIGRQFVRGSPPAIH